MSKRMFRLGVLSLVVLGLCISVVPAQVAAYVPPEQHADSAASVTGTEVLGGSPDEIGAAVIPGGGRPGVYIARDSDNLDPGFWPITGGYQMFTWKDLEPSEGVYDWAIIDNFLTALSAKGKAAGLQMMTYAGPKGGVLIPDWLRSRYPDLVLTMTPKLTSDTEPWRPALSGGCASWPTIEGIKYWDPRYLAAYQNFINALGARYKNDPRVEFVMAGVGLYGETQPAADCYDYYNLDAGLADATWTWVVQQISSYYAAAFNVGGTVKKVMLPAGSRFLHTCNRKEYMDYARALGLGDIDTGMLVEFDNAVIPDKPGFEGCGRLDPLLATQPTLPVGWESYWYMTSHPTLVYWALFQALGNHMDYITVDYAPNDAGHDGWMFADYAGTPRSEVISYFEWTLPYWGKSAAAAPSIWVAMRESGYTYYPQYGNWSYYLHQDDSIAGGMTKAVTYRGTIDPIDPNQIALLSYLVPKGYTTYNTNIETNVNLGGGWVGKESWIARRTDQATGNRYMWFKVDDGFLFGGSNEVTVKVTYFDYGTDSWKLEYDAAGGIQKTAGIVSKSNSLTWKVKTFTISDARMANGLLGASDFRIDCNNDGNEYIHFVEVTKGSSGTVNFDIPLRLGWNFVSIPLELGSTATESVLLPITGKYTKVYAYDAFDTGDQWKVYDISLPPFLNDLREINKLKGLWLYASQNTTFTVNGSWPTSSVAIPLKTGWNLIGYPSQTVRSVTDALSSIAGKYTKVYTYDAFDDADSWKVYDTSLPPFLNDLSQMQPGEAYWLYVTQDCTLTVNP